MTSPVGLFWVFLKLGLTSFGGPVAHLGYFREAFVVRRKWFGEEAWADLVALCQFLPGPASSQAGMAVGLSRAGIPGAVAAWAGFTLPSAILMILFAYGVTAWRDAIPEGLLHGLKLAAVAVVAQAVWGMARSLCPDVPRALIALATAAAMLAASTPLAQVGVILAAAIAGLAILRPPPAAPVSAIGAGVGRRTGAAALALFFLLLAGLPLLAAAAPSQALALVDSFYRAGALVFGGGHVVLPLLQAEVVPPGWVSGSDFLAGYGAAQAVPGPLFTFAAFLGAVMGPEPDGWAGALLCLGAIFAPSFLLVVGALPFWDQLRRSPRARRALMGVNAAVVGLLGAALWTPVWTGAVASVTDAAIAVAAFALLTLGRAPPLVAVGLCAAAGLTAGILSR